MQVNLSENLRQALNHAKEAAIKYANPAIGTEHLLFGLLMATESGASRILREYGLRPEPFFEIFARESGAGTKIVPFTPRVKSILINAYNIGAAAGFSEARTRFVLLSLLNEPAGVAYTILTQVFKINTRELFRVVAESIKSEMGGGAEQYGGRDKFGAGNFFGGSNADGFGQKQAYHNNLPPELESLGIDLTQKARQNKIDPVIGRKEEIERIIQILCRKSKNNPVLIGEPGVGKSAVVEGLALKIVSGNVPELLKGKVIFSLDMGSLVAGTKYRGSMEEKLKNAIAAIKNAQNIIVFIDEIHTLAGAGSREGEVSPADILKPYLSRGELQTIGATTTKEYTRFIEADKALERRFQPILVNPPGVDETITILKGLKENYEAFHGVGLTDEAIEAAAKLSDRYIMDRCLPDKAIDLIDEAMSKAKVSGNTVPKGLRELEEQAAELSKQKKDFIAREEYDKAGEIRDKLEELYKQIEDFKLNWSKKSERTAVITAEDIAEVVSKSTKIPVKRLSESETARLVGLEKILHERVVGQENAVESIAKAIRRARAGLKDPSKPIGTFLFLGPTGVGKTELTKALGEAVFDDENAVVRLDMSEYMESHSVSKLIGSPPGYVGFDDGGQLTEQVRRKPYSVVLFDEIEKANPDVYNILLQILDDGRLTDSKGRVVSFKNTIIIMTSNVGIADLKDKRTIGFSGSAGTDKDDKIVEDTLMSALRRHFKPEFLNRIDDISIFRHLNKDDMKKIAVIMLGKVQKTLKEKAISLEIAPEMMDFITQKGYDKEYGARPLRRTIQQYVEDFLAEQYLSGRIKDGDKIRLSYDGSKVILA